MPQKPPGHMASRIPEVLRKRWSIGSVAANLLRMNCAVSSKTSPTVVDQEWVFLFHS